MIINIFILHYFKKIFLINGHALSVNNRYIEDHLKRKGLHILYLSYKIEHEFYKYNCWILINLKISYFIQYRIFIFNKGKDIFENI